MTFNAIVWKMVKVNYRQYLLYATCNAFAIMFLFLFYSIYYNETIEQLKRSDSFDAVLAIPAAAMVLFMLLFIHNAHQMFIKKRKSEFGTFLAIGMTPSNILRLLLLENFVVAIVAIIVGLMTGALFAKLFVMLFAYFSPLNSSIFHLSFKMFSFTVLVYLLLFCITISITAYKIYRQTLLVTMQSKRVNEQIATRSPLFGYIGLTFILQSIVGLFFTYESHDYLLFFWAFLTFVGLFLFLANVIHLIIHLLKSSPSTYYRFILLFSSLSIKQKKLASLLSLMSIMVMITTLYATIMLFIAKEEYETLEMLNPSHIAFVTLEEWSNQDGVHQLFNEQNQEIKEWRSFPYLEIKTQDYYGYDNYVNVIRSDDYEQLFKQPVLLSDAQCIRLLNSHPEYGGFSNDERLDVDSWTCEVLETRTEQFVTHISQSVEYIVVNEQIWAQLQGNATLFYQHHLQVTNWKESTKAVSQFLLLDDAKSILNFTAKVNAYNNMQKENAVLFYLLSFLCVVFYFGAFILLYLNLFADIEIEKEKFKQLYKIGITKKELKKQLKAETSLLFFVPTFIGIALSFFYLFSMIQSEGGLASNSTILIYFFSIDSIYFVILLCFYFYVKTKLFKDVWNSVA